MTDKTAEAVNEIEKCAHREEHPHRDHCHEQKHLIAIYVDGRPYLVHPGKITVKKLKDVGHVPQAFELIELVDKKLIPLPDDSTVEISGCEHFVGIPKCGSSS